MQKYGNLAIKISDAIYVVFDFLLYLLIYLMDIGKG